MNKPAVKVALLFFYITCSGLVYAQQVGINILYPDSSAILHVESRDKGFLWPRMTTAERNAIPNPAFGLTIFNEEDSTIQYWNGICWLNVYQENCNACYFTVSASSIADTIDRTQTDSVNIQLTINQNAGTPQNIAFAVLGTLPNGMTVNITPNPQFSSGTATVTIKVTPFTPAGTYPVIIQMLCGSYFQNFIFSVTLTPCYQLVVNNSIANYNLAVDLYNTYPGAPTNSPVCVVATVTAGVDVTSVSASLPAFTTGTLPAGSFVAIVNNGNILGKGGDGGIATDPANGWTGAGFDGGDAIYLTANTTIQNNFNIYGGGGGGNAMAFGLSYNIPVINITLGILIGAGGGGGAGGSAGGNIPNIVGLTFYFPGTGGTGGQYGVPGKGGLLIVPISTTQGPVSISINPNAFGGDGGAYGFPGTVGAFQVTLSVLLTVNIPFVGPVTIPVVNNLNVPIPVPIPPPGNAGYAVRRNGFTTNIPDNNYNTSFLKGRVGP
ncbi:MAG: hypothetical protein KatS3mg031_0774 [Chitinophagales bacterium]|nr:MAG: hypothetical protein KatS3mg031_0774 [Chitinophagales bacterium]